MAHKDRKKNQTRGSRTCGYGNTQKHRGSGHRGGVGLGGSKKQKWMHVSKYMPGYFGKKGFKRPEKVLYEESVLNVSDLDSLVESWINEGKAAKEGDVYTVDLSSLGIDKLLGSGKVLSKYNIKVGKATEKAVNKITEAGGKIELMEEDFEEIESEPDAVGDDSKPDDEGVQEENLVEAAEENLESTGG